MQNYRRMRGEDLQGLNIEDLQQLERSLEVGLGRVLEKKVTYFILLPAESVFMLFVGFNAIEIFVSYRERKL